MRQSVLSCEMFWNDDTVKSFTFVEFSFFLRSKDRGFYLRSWRTTGVSAASAGIWLVWWLRDRLLWTKLALISVPILPGSCKLTKQISVSQYKVRLEAQNTVERSSSAKCHVTFHCHPLPTIPNGMLPVTKQLTVSNSIHWAFSLLSIENWKSLANEYFNITW